MMATGNLASNKKFFFLTAALYALFSVSHATDITTKEPMQINENFASQDIAWFKQCLANKKLIAALKNIKLIICDVDGTLTDAHVYVSSEGEGGRLFSTQDGFIVKHILSAGIKIAMISGKDNQSTIQRGKKLKITDDMLIVGMDAKHDAVKQVQQRAGVSKEATLIIGDDFLDAEMRLHNMVDLYACPANSPFYLQQAADVIIPRHGGNGAFRLLMDLVLYINGKHFAQALIDKTLL